MKYILYFIVYVICIFIFNACATAYYYTLSEPNYYLDKTSPIMIILPDNPTTEDKQFARILKNSMVENGFNVVDSKASCGVIFVLTEKTYDGLGVGSITTYGTTTYRYGQSSVTTTTPYTSYYTYKTLSIYKKIYIDIICISDDKKIDRKWQGFASAELLDYRKYKQNMIKNIINLMDKKDFDGKLFIDRVDDAYILRLQNQK